MFSLAGKKALITGATGGIGASILEAFLAQGASCVASGTNVEKLAKIESQYGCITKSCNLQSSDDISQLVAFAEEKLGGLDILVCNAGITKDGLLLRMKEEDWDAVLDTNLKSAFLLSKIAIKSMMKNRFGRIIYISSVVGASGNPGQANYVASKAGMVGLAKSIGQEVGSRGITVNCIAPGFVATPMTDVLTPEQSQAMLSKIPMGRFADPKEIASSAVFLASDEAAYITGATLHVNGGMYM